jgi:hypothetical protein
MSSTAHGGGQRRPRDGAGVSDRALVVRRIDSRPKDISGEIRSLARHKIGQWKGSRINVRGRRYRISALT